MRALANTPSKDADSKRPAKEAEKPAHAERSHAVPESTPCPCGGGCPSCKSEPSDAREQKSAMGRAFGTSFSDVSLRSGTALENGALAETEGNEVRFAPGAYEPASPSGRFRTAHEFAHVLQFRGGTPSLSQPVLPTAEAAEANARQAAALVMRGLQPVVAAYRGAARLQDDGRPTLQTSDDVQLFEGLQSTLQKLPDGEQRGQAIVFLVALAMQKGPAQEAATAWVKDMLGGVPTKRIFDHMAAIEALKSYVAHDVRAYDLLLFARMWFADHSKDDLGSTLVIPVFQRYLEYGGGKNAIVFLRTRLTGKDPLMANLAARIIADLLELENTPAAKKFRANYEDLRRMAMENDWGAKGPLGAASATPQIFSALESIRQEADKVARMIRDGPLNDDWRDKDAAVLETFVGALSAKGSLHRGDAVVFTAENREETEHEFLTKNGADTATWLQEMARTMALAADFGVRLEERVQLLRNNAQAYDDAMGGDASALDDRSALFELRHAYIGAWLSFAQLAFGKESFGLAAAYQGKLDEVERRFERFDVEVAQTKFKNARERFMSYVKIWNAGHVNYPGHDKVDDTFLSAAGLLLNREREALVSAYTTVGGSSAGGVTLTYDTTDGALPTNLELVMALDHNTSVFGMQAALFIRYAGSLGLQNTMLTAEVGDEEFRAEHGKTLADQRKEMEDLWKKNDWETFLKKEQGYRTTQDEVRLKIVDRAKHDFWENLAITIIASLVTEGAAAGLRLAALSETVALARTARAISAFPTLFRVGVFTTAQLTASAAFGQRITAGDVVKDLAVNLAFEGAFKGIEKFAKPFAPKSVFGKLLFRHAVGFGGMAGVSALMTRIETGEWPHHILTFLKETAITYLVMSAIHASFNDLVTNPALKKAAGARMENLKIANDALKADFQAKVESGALSKSEFEAMRQERKRLVGEGRAIAEVLKDGGVISPEDFESIKKMSDSAVADADNATFPVSGDMAGDPVVRGLPSPDSTDALVRVGDSNTYIVDPSAPHPEIETMLDKYKERGFTVEGNSELRRVVDPSGRTRFLLKAGPAPTTRLMQPGYKAPLMLPGHTDAPAFGGPLERASGLRGEQLEAARKELKTINREIEDKLPGEYSDYAVISAFSLLLEQAAVVKPNWSINAVRGLADAMGLERGIPRSAVRRLFGVVSPDQLPALFEAYHDIATSKNVSPGTQFAIADDMIPRKSVALIHGLRQMMARGMELPADMDMRAMRGLSKQMELQPNGWLDWLSNIAKDKRGQRLRAVSGLTDPTVRIPENLTELFANVSADIAGHAGLNALAAPTGEAFVQQIESINPNAKFDSPTLRDDFIRKVDKFQTDVAMVQQGNELKHGKLEVFVGLANEVRRTAKVLLDGNKILATDKQVGPKSLPNINLSDVSFPGGGKLDSGPAEKNVHMDLLFADSSGKMTAMEMTTGKIELPKALSPLDPKSPDFGKNVDWNAAAPPDRDPTGSERKFAQAIKIYMLGKVATALGTAWSGQPVDPATLLMSAGDFDAPAARALESLGFKLELKDGTPITAAEIEARAKK